MRGLERRVVEAGCNPTSRVVKFHLIVLDIKDEIIQT